MSILMYDIFNFCHNKKLNMSGDDVLYHNFIFNQLYNGKFTRYMQQC